MEHQTTARVKTQDLAEYRARHTLESLCPHAVGFDATMPDPYPILAESRPTAPVFYIPELAYWCITSWEGVAEVYRDPVSFSSAGMHNMSVPMPLEVRKTVGPDWDFNRVFKGQLNTTDPPQHTRIRKLMQKAFTPRQVSGRTDDIRGIATELIASFAGDDEVELVSRYTSPVPTRVIALVLGMDLDLAPRFAAWVDAFFSLSASPEMSEGEALRHWSALVEFETITREFVERRRRFPTDDLTSELIQAKSDDGEPSLTDDEVLANILGLIAAASDTTSILIANVVYMLLRTKQWSEVVADSGLVPGAVEEVLRLRSPVRGNRRTTTTDVSVCGVTIPAGESVYIQIGSANRDADVFAEPDTFDIRRANAAEHFGLGRWTHFCLGAPLARLEARLAVEALAARFPQLTLRPGQENELPYSYNLVVPVLHSLHVTW